MFTLEICAICGKPEDHVNHDTFEAPVYYAGSLTASTTTIGHEFEPTKEVD